MVRREFSIVKRRAYREPIVALGRADFLNTEDVCHFLTMTRMLGGYPLVSHWPTVACFRQGSIAGYPIRRFTRICCQLVITECVPQLVD